MCVCVCVRARERERDEKSGEDRYALTTLIIPRPGDGRSEPKIKSSNSKKAMDSFLETNSLEKGAEVYSFSTSA